MPSRVGATLVSHANMRMLVARTVDDYEQARTTSATPPSPLACQLPAPNCNCKTETQSLEIEYESLERDSLEIDSPDVENLEI